MKFLMILMFFIPFSYLLDKTSYLAHASDKNSSDKNLSSQTIESDISEIDFLVNKLDYLNRMLNPSYPGKKAIQLRLAHALFLASEENRILADKSSSHKQKASDYQKKAIALSKRSLKLYRQLDPVLKNKHPLLYAESLFKQAYLERYRGNPYRSLSILKKLVKLNDRDPLWKTRAWYNIGEIEFELSRHKKALKAFDEVLKQKESQWHFASRYRKIWSLFNLSLYEQAFKELYSFLNSKEYSKKDMSLDNQKWKQKLESEIEILYSYVEITKSRLDFLYDFLQSLTHSSTKKSLSQIAKLAKLLEPIGRLKASNQVWEFYLSKTNQPENQLMAYNSFLANELALAYPDKLFKCGKIIKKLLALQKQLGLNKTATLNIQRFFDLMHKSRFRFSKKQKLYLLSLYQESHLLYPKNFDLLVKAGDLAKELKNYPLAVSYYQKAVHTIKKSSPLKENLCFKQLEIAELSQKESLRLKAYNFYIKHGTQETLIFKSKYQIAYIDYTQNNFKKAYKLFYALAFYDLKKENSDSKDLKLKSAHLSLSTLKQIGNQEELIITKADEFRKAFVKDKKEFTKIYNLAILNQIKKWLEGKDFSYRPVQASTDKKIKKSWDLLARFIVKSADKPELLSYHINQLLLAKELLKFKDMDRSIQFLLSEPKLTTEDQKILFTWKLWLEELRLNFKQALKTFKELYPPNKNQSETDILNLARLSELAGESPVPYYKKIIKKYPKSPKISALVVSILEKSDQKSQKAFLIQSARFFKNKPEDLIVLVLKADQGERDREFLQSFLKLEFMRNSFLDRFLTTTKNISGFEVQLKKTQKYSSNKSLKSTALKSYTQAINTLISNSQEFLKTSDWSSRLFIVSALKKELQDFCDYVLQLPLPKNLNPNEKIEYKALLNDQIKVYKDQILSLDLQLKMLKSTDYLKTYKEAFQQSSVIQAYLEWEFNKLFEVLADSDYKQKIQQTVFVSKKSKERIKEEAKISQKKVQSLYQKLKNKPFDLATLGQLLKIEQDRKNTAWSFYLSQRIKELKNKKRN